MEYAHSVHPGPPLVDENSEILILGSLPSVKSREQMFFYGHPQNRFWPLLARLCEAGIPVSVEEKKMLLTRCGIALYDVIERCSIIGSSDSTIRDAEPADLRPILEGSRIGNRIYLNGGTAARLYEKYLYPQLHIHAVRLPSSSPANAAWTLERLYDAWGKELLPILKQDRCVMRESCCAERPDKL